MVHVTYDGQEVIAQPFSQQLPMDNAVLLKHSCHAPEFFFHYHPYYEISFILGTSGERVVGTSVEPYSEKDMVLLGPNLPHTWVARQFDTNNKATNYVLHFSRESLGQELLARAEMRHVRELLEKSHRGIRFNEEHIEDIGDQIYELPNVSKSRQFLSVISILDRLASQGGYEVLLSGDYQITWSEKDSLLFQRILDYIWANHTELFNRDDIAAHVGLSVSTFSRFFKRMTGKTLVAYVNELKVRRASELLISSNESIFDISFAVGYQNCSYFNKQFKAIMSMTPGEYRALRCNEKSGN